MIDIGPSISGLREQTEALAIQALTLGPRRTISPEVRASFVDSIKTIRAMVAEKMKALSDEYTKTVQPFAYTPFEYDELTRDIYALGQLEHTLVNLSSRYKGSCTIQTVKNGAPISISMQLTWDKRTTVQELKEYWANIFEVPPESITISEDGILLKDGEELVPLPQ